MKKMSLFLKIIATGSVSLLLAACYGTYAAMYGMPVTQRAGSFKIVDADTDEPIEGIRVSYLDEESTINYSNKDGLVEYNISICDIDEITVFLEDVDENQNGKYPEYTTESIDGDDDTLDIIRLNKEG